MKNKVAKSKSSDLLPHKKENFDFSRLLKANTIIYGRSVKTNLGKLNIGDKKAMNFLLRVLQETIRQNKIEPKGHVTLEFPANLYQWINDGPNWQTDLKNRLKKLADSKIELYDYYDPETKITTRYKRVNCLSSVDFGVNENGFGIVKATFPNEIATAQAQKKNFGYTHLEFKTINAFKSKYALSLYEVLVSKIQYFVNNNNIKLEYDIDKETLEKILELEFDDDENGFKHALQSRGFENIILPDLQKYLNCEVEIFGKDKIISFKFDEETIMRFVTKLPSEYDLALKQFQDLIHSSVEDGGDVFTATIGNKEIKAQTSTNYKVDNDTIIITLEKFMLDICKYYSNRSLIPPEKIDEFGDIIMTSSGKFVEKSSFKPLTHAKKIKLLKYLYKNRYAEIMSSITYAKNTMASGQIDALFQEYIGLYLKVRDGFLKIESINKSSIKSEFAFTVTFGYFKEIDDLLAFDRKLISFKNMLEFNDFVSARLYKRGSRDEE